MNTEEVIKLFSIKKLQRLLKTSIVKINRLRVNLLNTKNLSDRSKLIEMVQYETYKVLIIHDELKSRVNLLINNFKNYENG